MAAPTPSAAIVSHEGPLFIAFLLAALAACTAASILTAPLIALYTGRKHVL